MCVFVNKVEAIYICVYKRLLRVIFGLQAREFRDGGDLIQMQIKEEGLEQPHLGGE